MRIKSNDIPYLNCQKDKILSANPTFDNYSMYKYFEYVIERFNIQVKKDRGDKFPWTDNKILRENSFTCNRRVDDRTTKWLLNHISNNKELELSDRIWRTLIFRLYNKIETSELIKLDSPDFWLHIEEYADILDKQVNDVYTRAYKTVSIKYKLKSRYPNRNWRSLTLLGIRDMRDSYEGSIPEEIMQTADIALDWIKTIPGVGGFIGLQILIDLMYIDEIPYSNNCFVIAGPGARTGLDRIFINNDGMSYEECLFYITDNFERLCREYYDSEFDINYLREYYHDSNAYCVTDIQNTFCEYSKYRYLIEDKHKNKRKYTGGLK